LTAVAGAARFIDAHTIQITTDRGDVRHVRGERMTQRHPE